MGVLIKFSCGHQKAVPGSGKPKVSSERCNICKQEKQKKEAKSLGRCKLYGCSYYEVRQYFEDNPNWDKLPEEESNSAIAACIERGTAEAKRLKEVIVAWSQSPERIEQIQLMRELGLNSIPSEMRLSTPRGVLTKDGQGKLGLGKREISGDYESPDGRGMRTDVYVRIDPSLKIGEEEVQKWTYFERILEIEKGIPAALRKDLRSANEHGLN